MYDLVWDWIKECLDDILDPSLFQKFIHLHGTFLFYFSIMCSKSLLVIWLFCKMKHCYKCLKKLKVYVMFICLCGIYLHIVFTTYLRNDLIPKTQRPLTVKKQRGKGNMGLHYDHFQKGHQKLWINNENPSDRIFCHWVFEPGSKVH